MKISAAEVAPESLSSKLLRGELLAEDCPSRDVLRHVTSRWGVLVLLVLEVRTHRFSELRRAIGGVSERMLAQTLQWLEGDGLLERRALDVAQPHVEYSLTPLGREAAHQVRGLADWIEVNMHRVMDAQAQRAAAGAEASAQAGARTVVRAGRKRAAKGPAAAQR